MGLAIGEPLQNVSDVVLRGLNAKSLKSGLRKYNPEKSRPYNVVAKRKRPTAALSPGRGLGDEHENLTEYGDLSKESQVFLNDLAQGASCKMSLIKMQVVKCDETSSTLSRLQSCLRLADISEAERILDSLVDNNHSSLRELQIEISDGINIIQTIQRLARHLQNEKEDCLAAIAELNKGKAMSPRKVLEQARGQ